MATDPTNAHLELLDRLLDAVDRARGAHRAKSAERWDDALTDAFDVLSALYGAVEPTTSPEVSKHLTAAYDLCLRGLSEASTGRPEALEASCALVRGLRAVLASGRIVRAGRRAA